MVMDRLLGLMAEKKASDLFLAAGSPVHLKINGVAVPVSQQRLEPWAVVSMIREITTDRQWQIFEDRHELNFGYGLRGIGSFRVNVFQQRGSASSSTWRSAGSWRAGSSTAPSSSWCSSSLR